MFNVVALAFFGLSLFQVIESFPEPELTPILNVVLFLLGYKLFHRRNNRDYLQIYVLSFLLVLAAAWLAQTIFFVVGFVAYVVLATWTLILFHLRREIEDNYLVKHLPESGIREGHRGPGAELAPGGGAVVLPGHRGRCRWRCSWGRRWCSR